MVDTMNGSFKNGMKDFANTLSILTNTALISLVYLTVGITAIIARATGRDFLEENKPRWKASQEEQDIYRQF
ncbi:MAG: hypothetical protein ACQESG_00140 [Nanobdellota archaeon]